MPRPLTGPPNSSSATGLEMIKSSQSGGGSLFVRLSETTLRRYHLLLATDSTTKFFFQLGDANITGSFTNLLRRLQNASSISGDQSQVFLSALTRINNSSTMPILGCRICRNSDFRGTSATPLHSFDWETSLVYRPPKVVVCSLVLTPDDLGIPLLHSPVDTSETLYECSPASVSPIPLSCQSNALPRCGNR